MKCAEILRPVRAMISDVLQQVGKQIVGHTHLQSRKFMLSEMHQPQAFQLKNYPFEILKDSAHTVSAPVAKQMAEAG